MAKFTESKFFVNPAKFLIGKEVLPKKQPCSDALLREIFMNFGDKNGRKDY